MPVYGWVRANMETAISEHFGSVEQFEDHYEFDMAHIFGGPRPYDAQALEALRQHNGRPIEPSDLLDIPLNDPNDQATYKSVSKEIEHHKKQRGRFVYKQTPGIFEILNGPFGIENHLMYLALFPDDLRQVYQRQAQWNRQYAMNCLDMGIDMIHVSDDWGAQTGLMFSPQTWRDLIFPYHKITADAVRERDAYLSLHSDGNITSILKGIVEIGYQVVHPYQVSAGMDYDDYFANYADQFAIMGGLDIQTTLGFGNLDRLKAEIDDVVNRFAERGMLLCTTHFVQDHCSIDELVFAFDHLREAVNAHAN